MRAHKPSAIIVDEDLDLATLVTGILNDDGFVATLLTDPSALRALVELLEPDVILIDIKGYGDDEARKAIAWLHQRANPIPVVMCTTSEEMVRSVGVTPGGKKFVAAVLKPFNVGELVDKLREVVAERAPLPKQEHVRPVPSLSDLLRRYGIRDIQSATDCEWVVFKDKCGAKVQIYWWEQASAYCISRMRPGANALEDLGRTKSAADAVARALSACR